MDRNCQHDLLVGGPDQGISYLFFVSYLGAQGLNTCATMSPALSRFVGFELRSRVCAASMFPYGPNFSIALALPLYCKTVHHICKALALDSKMDSLRRFFVSEL